MARFNWLAFQNDLYGLTGRSVTESEARAVRRDIQRHQTIQEAYCSEEMSDERRARVEARERGVERRLRAFFGRRLAEFSGDPRGGTVKLHDVGAQPLCDIGRPVIYFSRDWGGHLIFTGYRR